jgi:hypothetical protein
VEPGHRPTWGEAAGRGRLGRIADRVRDWISPPRPASADVLPRLPAALRRMPLAEPYLAAAQVHDHRRAGAAAGAAADEALEARAWWAADAWAHRALWHYERADMALAATRQARRIGDLRTLAGDPRSARRYYAEAISEARDIGAEREEGLASLGLGRAHLELGDAGMARRLARIAEDLLLRADAPAAELAAAQELRGDEKAVGEVGPRGPEAGPQGPKRDPARPGPGGQKAE